MQKKKSQKPTQSKKRKIKVLNKKDLITAIEIANNLEKALSDFLTTKESDFSAKKKPRPVKKRKR